MWLPDSTEKLEASERAGALGIQAAGINRHSPRDHSAKVIRAESLCQCRSREGEALGSTAPPDCTHDVAGMVKPLQEIRLLAPGQG